VYWIHTLTPYREVVMRRLIAVAAALTLACGGSDGTTGIDGDPGIAADITVEQGADQRAPILDVMPDSVIGRVMDDQGRAVGGQTVNLVIPAGEEAGRWTGLSGPTGTLTTDAQGRVFAELQAGTRAWTSRVVDGEDSAYVARLVASREGRADEIEELTFAVEPGEPVVGDDRDVARGATGGGLTGDSPHTVPAGNTFAAVRDQHENPVPWGLDVPGDIARVEEADDRIGGLRTVVAESAGCGPIYVRTEGGRGAKADSGIALIRDTNDDGTADRVEITIGTHDC
jgi:hypothetical protein